MGRCRLFLLAILVLHCAAYAQQPEPGNGSGINTTHSKGKRKSAVAPTDAETSLITTAKLQAQSAPSPGMQSAPCDASNRGMRAYAMPSDNHLIVFPFDANAVYPIKSHANLFTRIALAPNEKVSGFYLSDQIRWIHSVSKSRDNVFVMPLEEGLNNTATLVTNLHTYDLSITSVPESDCWYQRVSWHIPLSNFEEEITDPTVADADKNGAVDALPSGRRDPRNATIAGGTDGDAGSQVNVKSMNFNYTIEGDASFRPTMVFDDGQNTWLKLPEHADAPVFFALAKDGTAEPVHPYPRDGYMVVQQPLPYGLLLMINKDEVRIKSKKFDCGWFSRNCTSATSNITH